MESNQEINQRFDKVKQLRDELRVQANLGKKELKERWERAESEFQNVQGRLKTLREKGEESTEKFRRETLEMVDHLRNRFESLRN